jgi:hypothetical protein
VRSYGGFCLCHAEKVEGKPGFVLTLYNGIEVPGAVKERLFSLQRSVTKLLTELAREAPE